MALAIEFVPARAHLPDPGIRGLDVEPWLGPHVEFHADLAELVFDRSALRLPLRAPGPTVIQRSLVAFSTKTAPN